MSPWVPRVALAGIALIVAAVLVSLAVGEGGLEPRGVSGANEVQRTFGGIPQQQAEIGSPEAEVTVSVFNDLQCTACADFHVDVVEPLIDPYVRSEDARLELRHFSIGRHATTLAAIAAVAAGEQGYQWQYAGLFVRNQELAAEEGVTEGLLREVAEGVLGLQVDEWERDVDAPEVLERVEADAELAADLELPAEPAVVIAGPGGQRELTGSPTLAEIEAAIAELG